MLGTFWCSTAIICRNRLVVYSFFTLDNNKNEYEECVKIVGFRSMCHILLFPIYNARNIYPNYNSLLSCYK